MTFEENAIQDLDELLKLDIVTQDRYEKTKEVIEQEAEENSNMKVADFVDMCLNLASIRMQ